MLLGQRDDIAQPSKAAVTDIPAIATSENRGVLLWRARVSQAPDSDVLADNAGTGGGGGCLI